MNTNIDLTPTGIMHNIYITYTPTVTREDSWQIFDTKQEALEHAISLHENGGHHSKIWNHTTDEISFSDPTWSWLNEIKNSTLITYHPYTSETA